MIIAGLDIGTTGSKISIFENGRLLSSFYLGYPSIRKNEEQTIDIESLKNAVLSLTKKAVEEYPDLRAIGITSFGETFVLLDEEDNVLFDCMLYTDSRGEEEKEFLYEKYGNDYFASINGLYPNGMFSICKILYVKNNYPEIFNKTKKILLIEDYIVYLLSSVRQIDYSLASRTLCFDIKKKEWDKKLLSDLGIPVELFSKPVPTGTIAGEMRDSLKKEYGINHSLLIVNVAHDQIANLVGAGAYYLGSAADGLGTCECLTPIFPKTADMHLLAKHGYAMVPVLNTDDYCCYAFTPTAGALNSWIMDTFYQDVEPEQRFKVANQSLKEEPNSLYVLPYFAGSGTPYNDKTMGCFVGLSLNTQREDFYQAAVECLCFENKLNVEYLKKAGVEVNDIFVSGGGSANDMWLQIKADVLNKPIHQLADKNAGAVGTAIIIGVSLGVYKDYQDGINQLVKVKKTFYPNEKYVSLYQKKYERYIKIYDAMKKEGF